MKFCRFFLFRMALGGVLLALAGCDSSAPTDTSSTQTTSNQIPPSKPGWGTSYEQGRQEAKAGNKLVLLDFTGSDWCIWCQRTDKEVFETQKFKDFANQNFLEATAGSTADFVALLKKDRDSAKVLVDTYMK